MRLKLRIFKLKNRYFSFCCLLFAISLFVYGLFFSFNPIKKVVPKRIVQAHFFGIWASFKGRFVVKFSFIPYFDVTQTFTARVFTTDYYSIFYR